MFITNLLVLYSCLMIQSIDLAFRFSLLVLLFIMGVIALVGGLSRKPNPFGLRIRSGIT